MSGRFYSMLVKIAQMFEKEPREITLWTLEEKYVWNDFSEEDKL